MKMNIKKQTSNILTFYIKNTMHNTFISICKETILNKNNKIIPTQQVLKIFSCGLFGFKNRKKETPFASSILANKSALYALQNDIKYIHIIFKGMNFFKKLILNTIMKTKYNNRQLHILSITDITQYPHNGCRQKKIKKR
uniref:Ribosomal protein S11 n=1 Tax=Cyclospora cayetanensis TaxID=88456 RepID=A0A0K0NU03_9EIME|nr:ribosomal protein S11 [Cyclospora cayetanensis]AKO72003.1 ribosomal protein S11 [Cyclospora cayetanensis]